MPRVVEKVNAVLPKMPRLTRVAAYARVSSEKDAMHHSLSAQISYYSNLIQSHHGWVYAGVYADEAKTGTKDTRENFCRLLTDCESGKIDLIITKSVSRFARNTLLLLETVRHLKELGIDVYFEEQGIHTLSTQGELMLSIIASVAQAESLSVSENMKWRIRKNFSEGKPWGGKMLGYRIGDGCLRTVENESELVRRIFSDYLSGKGYYTICKELNAEGVPTETGAPWKDTTVARILKNYDYTGNLILQKTFRSDHISKKCRLNRGELPKYMAEGTHTPIIDIDTFNAVQSEMKSRAEDYTHDIKTGFERFPLTGKIVCGNCGKHYNRKTVRGKKVWICSTFNKRGKAFCPSKQIPEDIILGIAEEITDNLDSVESIIAGNDNSLVFVLKNGNRIQKVWQDRSRADSWTDEMKKSARRKTLERMMKCG